MKNKGSRKISFLLCAMSVCLYMAGENKAYIQLIVCFILSAQNVSANTLHVLPLVEQNPSLHSIRTNLKTMFP
jgi:hypothetical protein